MITITNTDKRTLDYCSGKHKDGLKPIIEKRLNSKKISSQLSPKQIKFIIDHLDIILTALPTRLILLHKLASKKYNIDKTVLNKIFNYDSFIDLKKNDPVEKYTPYTLAANLDIVVCPYCNMNYTHTVVSKTKKIIRPDFDHFFPQSLYPLLALSFYNLIPSCLICNSRLKRDQDVTLKDDWHPYEDNLCHRILFKTTPRSLNGAHGINHKELDIEINIDSTSSDSDKKKLERTIEMFKLQERYEMHSDLASEIHAKYYRTNGAYLQSLQRAFLSAKFTKQELYRIAFANYHEDDGYGLRPLSKLTADIVNSFNFVLPDCIDESTE